MAIQLPSYDLLPKEEQGATYAAARYNEEEERRLLPLRKEGDPPYLPKTPRQFVQMRIREMLRQWYLAKVRADADLAAQAVIDANPPDALQTIHKPRTRKIR